MDLNDYIDKLFDKTYSEFLKEMDDDKLEYIKEYISNWFVEMYEKDTDSLKKMVNSDDLLIMVKRELRFSKLLNIKNDDDVK